MTPDLEKNLSTKAQLYLKKGRNGDWEHTLRTLEYARKLLAMEPADEDIVIPALYLHDTGWSAIDYTDFMKAPPAQIMETQSLRNHMQQSARIAGEVLQELGFAADVREHIVSIIAVHDEPEKIFALNDISANLVMEADRLDRYGLRSIKRYEDMFGTDYLKEASWIEGVSMRKEGLTAWFKTKTGRALAFEMAEEMGLLSQDED